jgi:hypothetical protein
MFFGVFFGIPGHFFAKPGLNKEEGQCSLAAREAAVRAKASALWQMGGCRECEGCVNRCAHEQTDARFDAGKRECRLQGAVSLD